MYKERLWNAEMWINTTINTYYAIKPNVIADVEFKNLIFKFQKNKYNKVIMIL